MTRPVSLAVRAARLTGRVVPRSEPVLRWGPSLDGPVPGELERHLARDARRNARLQAYLQDALSQSDNIGKAS